MSVPNEPFTQRFAIRDLIVSGRDLKIPADEYIVDTIVRFGQLLPVTITPTGHVLDGVRRLAAMRAAGYEEAAATIVYATAQAVELADSQAIMKRSTKDERELRAFVLKQQVSRIRRRAKYVTMRNDPTALYRLLDAGGTLLYVGITFNPQARWRQHAKDKPWWSQVAEKKVEWFMARDEAEQAEARAIQGEWPRHNGIQPVVDYKSYRL